MTCEPESTAENYMASTPDGGQLESVILILAAVETEVTMHHRRRKILKVGGAKDMIARAKRAQKFSDHAHFRSNRTHL